LPCKGFQIRRGGLEPKDVSDSEDKDLQKQPNQSGAKSGALSKKTAQIDSDLQQVTNSWPKLSANIKAGILALIEASLEKEGE